MYSKLVCAAAVAVMAPAASAHSIHARDAPKYTGVNRDGAHSHSHGSSGGGSNPEPGA